MKNSIKQGLIVTTALAPLLVPASAAAQDTDQESDENIIIVTAKGREQALQEVPLAISVFSEDDLEVRGISNVQELADFTPNLEINSPTGGRDTVIAVRGLSSSTTDEKYQSVGFFVDGIWMGGQVVGLSTADVERIEVIKGPHSTFGRATYGASIDYVTKTPSLDEFSGRVQLQFSDRKFGVDPNYQATGSVSGPIIPGALSFSLFAQQRFDSGIESAEGAPILDVGERESTIFSGVLYAQLGSNTSLKVRGMYTENNNVFINAFEANPQYWLEQGANVLVNGNNQAWISGAVPDPIRTRFYGDDVNTTHLAGTASGGIDSERYFISGILEHEFDSGISIRYAGSYMEQEENALFDGLAPVGRNGGIDPVVGDVTGLTTAFGGGFNNVIGEEWSEMSHTLRIVSSDVGPFTWYFGGFYYDSDNTNSTPNVGFQAFFPAGNTTGLNRIEEIEQWAVFGELAYAFSDQFSVSLEGRYQDETVGRVAVPNALFSTQRLGENISVSEKNFDPRITISYQPNENHNLYALFAQGHKPGRYNLSSRAPFVNGVRPADSFVYVEPERLRSYELGWKGAFPDSGLLFNIAAFYQDIENQQFIASVTNPNPPPALVTQLSNVGGSEIWGVEADFTWEVTDNLTIQAAAGYNDQEFSNNPPTPSQNAADNYIFNFAGDAVGAETIDGRSFTNVSKFSGNFAATYSVPVSVGEMFDDFSLRTDVLYRGKRYVDSANLAYIPSNVRVNLRASLSGENWDLSLFGLNILDDKTANRGTSFPCGITSFRDGPTATALGLPAPAPTTAFAGGQRCLYLVPSAGREIGLSLTMKL